MGFRFDDIVFVYQLRDERQLAWHGRLHSHPAGRYEFHYFISGEGSFRNGDATYSIGAGTLHLSPPGSVHQIVATDSRRPISYYAVLVEAEEDEELSPLLAALRSARGPRAIGCSHRFFFADLLRKQRSGRRELELSARHNFLAFLYDLAAGGPSAHGSSDNVHVEKALAIMQGSIERSLDLEALCGRLGLSREHFVRLFAERMGMPPMRYFTGLKIEAARAMLSSTNLRVGEIAEKLGYENQFGFSRAFARVAGLAPSAYRASCLQRADFAAE
ncbi:MAG TPA: AraC family transcriptional regulator [Spirochaetia bacterium]|nr:AraC family transcriptional regulator [Spirochaetales bacterium]HRY73909.1 AraC family transcriptional regulator [Spirochaetia bacterium]